MMRKQLLAGTAFAAMAMMGTVAFAADMPAPAPVAPPPLAPAPVPIFYDWTGFYVGAHAGFNWERKRIHYPGYEAWTEIDLDPPLLDVLVTSFPAHRRLEADGFHGGIQGGFNWQWDQIVLGIEGDFSWTNAKDSRTFQGPFEWVAFIGEDDVADGEGFSTATWSQRIKWFGTARARIGWAFENILLYGTGGFAWKRSELTLFGTVPDQPEPGGPFESLAFSSKDSNTHTGWVAGLGAEIGVTENVSIKGEWLYMDLGKKTYNMVVPLGEESIVTPTRVKLTEHVIRVGLNWRFVTAPAAAPMAPAPAPVKW